MSYPRSTLPLTVAELPLHIGETVRIGGWVHTTRHLGSLSFLVLRDHTGITQVLLTPEDRRLSDETVVSALGEVVEDTRAPGGVELHQAQVEVLSPAESPLPVHLGSPHLETRLPARLTHAPIALRHPTGKAVQALRASLVTGFRHSLSQMGFTEIFTPKIVESATESGADVFRLDYFGTEAYLAQSPQFYKQMMVGVLGRVFEVGPVFRAEPHHTARHLSQYTSLDAEMGFIEDHRTLMTVIHQVLRGMLQEAASPLSLLGLNCPEVPNQIPVIAFREALDLVSRATGENLLQEPDLAPAHERWLGAWTRQHHGSDFLFVESYPAAKRPFYTHPSPEGGTRSFDLLFRGQELITGGQRLHRYEDYLKALDLRGLDRALFEGYLEAFRFGMPPHGGFALGLERMVARLAHLDNIREAALFPRDQERLRP